MLFKELNKAIREHWKDSEDWVSYGIIPDKYNVVIQPIPGRLWVIHIHHAANVGRITASLKEYQRRDYHGFEFLTSIDIWYFSGYRVERKGKELLRTDDLKQLLDWVITGFDARIQKMIG